MALQPWHRLPPEVAPALRPVLPAVAEEVIEAVRTIPVYARPLEGEFGRGLRLGVQEGLSRFLAEIAARRPLPRSDVYAALGREEMRAGRSLESLLSAYRLGASAAWRRFAAAGQAAGLEPETLYLLAEGVFVYIDSLAAESAEAHAAEQSAAAGEAQLRRRRLVRLLVRDPPVDAASAEIAAIEAQWPLPRTLAAIAIGGEARGAAAAHLPPEAIGAPIDDITCVLLPDPDGPGRQAAVERAILRVGAAAGVGTSVGWQDAMVSLSRARGALALGGGAAGVVTARERAGELLLRADPRLASEFVAERLAPLAGLPAGSRARLTETLKAWTDEQGRIRQVAARLRIHPQSARYRIGRLRELFGAALDDPGERFWLALALRVQG